jgi:hypothetical protein
MANYSHRDHPIEREPPMPTPAETDLGYALANKYARECGGLAGLITRALIALRYGFVDAAIADLEEGYRIAHNGEQITYLHDRREAA